MWPASAQATVLQGIAGQECAAQQPSQPTGGIGGGGRGRLEAVQWEGRVEGEGGERRERERWEGRGMQLNSPHSLQGRGGGR